MTTAAATLDPQDTPPTSKNQTSMRIQSDHEVVIERTFNAPPAIVFKAWTRTELVRQWWVPNSCGMTMTECSAELRPGGAYRYALRNPDGSEVGFSGTYTEITPPTKLVYTQVFEPMAQAGHVVITVTFEERPGGKTHLISHEAYPSKEALDAAVSAGMEFGMRLTMDQLDELVASLA